MRQFYQSANNVKDTNVIYKLLLWGKGVISKHWQFLFIFIARLTYNVHIQYQLFTVQYFSYCTVILHSCDVTANINKQLT